MMYDEAIGDFHSTHLRRIRRQAWPPDAMLTVDISLREDDARRYRFVGVDQTSLNDADKTARDWTHQV